MLHPSLLAAQKWSTGPKPVLISCSAGQDRSAPVAAYIYAHRVPLLLVHEIVQFPTMSLSVHGSPQIVLLHRLHMPWEPIESCNGLYVDGPPGQAKATQSYCCQNSARRFSSALDDRLLTPQRAVVVEDRDPVRREDEVGTSRGRHSLDEVEDRLLGRAIVPGRKRGCGRITLHGWSCHSRLIS